MTYIFVGIVAILVLCSFQAIGTFFSIRKEWQENARS